MARKPKWRPISKMPDDQSWLRTIFVWNDCNGPQSIWPQHERDSASVVDRETVREWLLRRTAWTHWVDPEGIPGLPDLE
ncbi:hypothetical protein ATO13_22446 [Stappia sp. 22II-S9-Z10]|nr:hypothetical protein ATO13_22446 [Stappia sp. 22II-S9-Z10]